MVTEIIWTASIVDGGAIKDSLYQNQTAERINNQSLFASLA